MNIKLVHDNKEEKDAKELILKNQYKLPIYIKDVSFDSDEEWSINTGSEIRFGLLKNKRSQDILCLWIHEQLHSWEKTRDSKWLQYVKDNYKDLINLDEEMNKHRGSVSLESVVAQHIPVIWNAFNITKMYFDPEYVKPDVAYVKFQRFIRDHWDRIKTNLEKFELIYDVEKEKKQIISGGTKQIEGGETIVGQTGGTKFTLGQIVSKHISEKGYRKLDKVEKVILERADSIDDVNRFLQKYHGFTKLIDTKNINTDLTDKPPEIIANKIKFFDIQDPFKKYIKNGNESLPSFVKDINKFVSRQTNGTIVIDFTEFRNGDFNILNTLLSCFMPIFGKGTLFEFNKYKVNVNNGIKIGFEKQKYIQTEKKNVSILLSEDSHHIANVFSLIMNKSVGAEVTFINLGKLHFETMIDLNSGSQKSPNDGLYLQLTVSNSLTDVNGQTYQQVVPNFVLVKKEEKKEEKKNTEGKKEMEVKEHENIQIQNQDQLERQRIEQQRDQLNAQYVLMIQQAAGNPDRIEIITQQQQLINLMYDSILQNGNLLQQLQQAIVNMMSVRRAYRIQLNRDFRNVATILYQNIQMAIKEILIKRTLDNFVPELQQLLNELRNQNTIIPIFHTYGKIQWFIQFHDNFPENQLEFIRDALQNDRKNALLFYHKITIRLCFESMPAINRQNYGDLQYPYFIQLCSDADDIPNWNIDRINIFQKLDEILNGPESQQFETYLQNIRDQPGRPRPVQNINDNQLLENMRKQITIYLIFNVVREKLQNRANGDDSTLYLDHYNIFTQPYDPDPAIRVTSIKNRIELLFNDLSGNGVQPVQEMRNRILRDSGDPQTNLWGGKKHHRRHKRAGGTKDPETIVHETNDGVICKCAFTRNKEVDGFTCLMDTEIKRLMNLMGNTASSPHDFYQKLIVNFKCESAKEGVDQCIRDALVQKYGDRVEEVFQNALPLKDQIDSFTQWLSSSTIDLLCKQIENASPKFKYMGIATWDEFEDQAGILNINHIKNSLSDPDKKVFGFVLNQCNKYSPGQHWVGMCIVKGGRNFKNSSQELKGGRNFENSSQELKGGRNSQELKGGSEESPGGGRNYEGTGKDNLEGGTSDTIDVIYYDSQDEKGPELGNIECDHNGKCPQEKMSYYFPYKSRFQDWWEQLKKEVGYDVNPSTGPKHNNFITQKDTYSCGYHSVYFLYLCVHKGEMSIDAMHSQIMATTGTKTLDEFIHKLQRNMVEVK